MEIEHFSTVEEPVVIDNTLHLPCDWMRLPMEKQDSQVLVKLSDIPTKKHLCYAIEVLFLVNETIMTWDRLTDEQQMRAVKTFYGCPEWWVPQHEDIVPWKGTAMEALGVLGAL